MNCIVQFLSEKFEWFPIESEGTHAHLQSMDQPFTFYKLEKTISWESEFDDETASHHFWKR